MTVSTKKRENHFSGRNRLLSIHYRKNLGEADEGLSSFIVHSRQWKRSYGADIMESFKASSFTG